MRNRSFKINRHYKNMTIKSKWRLRRGGVWVRAPFPPPGRGLVVTMWRKGEKWDNMEEIFYVLGVEYYYGALFGGDHIKSPF
jgi:hypothetical protein